VKTISTPTPEHHCELPGRFAGMSSNGINQHHEPVGTVVECDCGRRYISEPWPGVTRGQQMVGNRWVAVQRPLFPKWLRRSWMPLALGLVLLAVYIGSARR
jgi:hypothetical protein